MNKEPWVWQSGQTICGISSSCIRATWIMRFPTQRKVSGVGSTGRFEDLEETRLLPDQLGDCVAVRRRIDRRESALPHSLSWSSGICGKPLDPASCSVGMVDDLACHRLEARFAPHVEGEIASGDGMLADVVVLAASVASS